MALSYTTSNIGIALIRRPAGGGSGDWVHVSWVNGERDMYVDSPGSGNWEYALAQVIGSATGANSIVVSGRQTLVVANIKK